MSSRARASKPGRWLDPGVTPAERELRFLLDVAARREADEVALRRVWARLAHVPDLVHSEPFHSGGNWRRWWPWALSASLVGAAAAVLVLLLGVPSMTRRRISGPSEGAATLAVEAPAATPRSDHDGRKVENRTDTRAESVLLAPATVRTRRGQVLPLALRGGTTISLSGESELSLDERDRPTVAMGEVQFHVPPQSAGQAFVVMARQYRLSVLGTKFVVRVGGANASVKVEDGVVEVWEVGKNQRVARVGTGESWESPIVDTSARSLREGTRREADPEERPRGASSPHAATTNLFARRAPRLQAMIQAMTSGAHRKNAVGPELTGGGVHAGKTAGLQSASGTQAPRAPENVTRPSGPSLPPVAAPTPTLSGGTEPTTVTVNAGAASVAPSPAVPASVVTATAAPTAQLATLDLIALTIQAKTARASGDPQRALALYRVLADKGGPAGENAEYEMGRVYRDSLSEPEQAIATWRTYRARHPRGLLRIEADISVIETLLHTRDKVGALAEASDFVNRYPDGERHAEMARLVGDLSRERGEWRAAIEAYDDVLSDGRARPRFRDEVSFHRATCLLASDPHLGARALQAYLKAFPAGQFAGQAERLVAEASARPRSAQP